MRERERERERERGRETEESKAPYYASHGDDVDVNCQERFMLLA